jgi:hypothetical protein
MQPNGMNDEGICLQQRAQHTTPRAPDPCSARRHRPADGASEKGGKMCVAAPQENEMTVPQGKTGCAFVFSKLITKEDP